MTALQTVLSDLSAEVARLSETAGRRVNAMTMGVLDRSPFMRLGPAGRSISPNGSCRMLRAADGGWLALNLARPEDVDLLPAWLEDDVPTDVPWPQVEALAARREAADLLARTVLLGLPAARVGEAEPLGGSPPTYRHAPATTSRSGQPKVVDLSALWAGPLCGAIFAGMGAEVVRIATRHDPTEDTTPELFRRLNGGKTTQRLDPGSAADRTELLRQVRSADVVITSARPRAFPGLGLELEDVFTGREGLVWIAITAHGWTGDAAHRVGFGDDTAAAGGLVAIDSTGAPVFLGDALADPITGLMAAAAGLRAVQQGGGVLVDVAMSRCAATAAVRLRQRSAA